MRRLGSFIGRVAIGRHTSARQISHTQRKLLGWNGTSESRRPERRRDRKDRSRLLEAIGQAETLFSSISEEFARRTQTPRRPTCCSLARWRLCLSRSRRGSSSSSLRRVHQGATRICLWPRPAPGRQSWLRLTTHGYETNCPEPVLLFVAHRSEILEQSLLDLSSRAAGARVRREVGRGSWSVVLRARLCVDPEPQRRWHPADRSKPLRRSRDRRVPSCQPRPRTTSS